jgi:glycosyltransferase involved in cell wall biosynthesis
MHTLLSINNYYYVRGGAEYVFLEHNKIFEQAGWNIVPFAMHHSKNMSSEWSQHFVEEIEFGEPYGPSERIRKALKAIYSTESRKNIAALIDKVRPAIAHSHNIYHHISPSILSVLKQHGIPSLMTLHDLKIACPAYRMMTHDGICERCKGGRIWNALSNRCMHDSIALSAWVTVEAFVHKLLKSYERNVDKFIVPSRFYLEKFVEWGWDREKFEHIPNFVDAKVIKEETRPGEQFLFFGRLSPEKGVDTFLRASAKAGVSSVIVGTGPLEQQLKRTAADLDADVEFTGFLSGEALFDRIRSARAVVIPSEWYENAPISVIEAFACGKPVLGADIAGIPELIHQNRGRVFESASIDSLAEVLTEVSDLSENEMVDMGRAARRYVVEEHSRQAYLDRCQDVYAQFIA